MTLGLIGALGGIGLFLLGMVMLTEGLRGLAGDALERTLRRFTRSPTSGAAVGALATAVVQSSSATTVTAVGFAGAGLLEFPQALGIVFGANIGTTVTGWMVALLGFKLDISLLVPGFVLGGALLRLFGHGRTERLGRTLAGFGLIFLGLELLKEGMGGLAELVTPRTFPADDVLGRLLLLGIGIAMTLVTQSSSAGVVAALSALAAGAIEFTQAAALVIGMDVGTTVTAALATVGGSLPARRTGWAHVIYNLLTAMAAFALLPTYVWALESLLPGATAGEPELALVGFHTSFNALGVLAILPVARPFARLVEWIVPAREQRLDEALDERLLGEPTAALRAAAVTLGSVAQVTFAELAQTLRGEIAAPELAARLAPAGRALLATQSYVGRIAAREGVDPREVAAWHVIDRLDRLLDRCAQAPRIDALMRDATLREHADRLASALPLSRDAGFEVESRLEAMASQLDREHEAYRESAVRLASADRLSSTEALARMDGFRWLVRIAHHARRSVHHLQQLAGETAALAGPEPREPA